MDPMDERILQVLSKEARISNVDLAGRVGLSASACLRRVERLEREGAITGYRAVIGPAARGIGFVAYMAIGLNDHTKRAQEAFERSVEGARQVVECHNVTGTFEYMLRVEVADLAAFKHFHTEVIGTLPQVASITTYVVMGSPKDERA